MKVYAVTYSDYDEGPWIVDLYADEKEATRRADKENAKPHEVVRFKDMTGRWTQYTKHRLPDAFKVSEHEVL